MAAWLEKLTTRKRLARLGSVRAVRHHYKVRYGAAALSAEGLVIETEYARACWSIWTALGIDNVLVLQGDAIQPKLSLFPEPDGLKSACVRIARTCREHE